MKKTIESNAVTSATRLRILFLCGRNRRRSPTAEIIFRGCAGIEVDSAGVRPDADVLVTADHIDWADLIILMENRYRRPLKSLMGGLLKTKRIVSLDIADDYELMDPALVELVRQRMLSHLP